MRGCAEEWPVVGGNAIEFAVLTNRVLEPIQVRRPYALAALACVGGHAHKNCSLRDGAAIFVRAL